MRNLDVDVVNDAKRMLNRAADRLHQLTVVLNNVDEMSKRKAETLHAEAMALIHAAVARID